MVKELLSPILEGGIRNTNFFNGRLLTAEDLQVEQEATRRQLRRLGRAAGEGVISGLEVRVGTASGAQPTLHVNAGLALNRAGQVLGVPEELEEVEVALIREQKVVPTGSGLFAVCQPPTSTAVPTNIGVYILVMSPAAGYQERAPKVGAGDNGVAQSCGSRYAVEGIQFRLVLLDVQSTTIAPGELGNEIRNQIESTGAANRARFRNLIAHLCLGTAGAGEFAADLFRNLTRPSWDISYGPLDVLRAQGQIADCDVPLALVFWGKSGIEFVDMWSVRRSVHTGPAAADPPFPALDRRTAELEGTFLQFQEQIALLSRADVTQSTIDTIRCADYFRFLPSVGVLPLDSATSKGFDYSKFFNGLTYRKPVFIEGAKVQPLLRLSFAHAPFDVGQKEVIWLYLVRENWLTPTGGSTRQPYLIFTGGHVPYQGDAQYDLARWNYSNYGPGVADEPVIGG